MDTKKKVLVGMSGGVDSSVCALLLQKQGYEVTGCMMKLWEGNDSDDDSYNNAKTVCDKLGIELLVADFKEDFKKYVIEDFIEEYKNCRTPNPCIVCNKFMKFDKMLEFANEHGIEYIATGHYAKTIYSDKYNKYVVMKSNSEKKDQTYVLYNIPKDKVDKIIFPLGDFESKDEIRKIAEENDLVNAKRKDSQDICFIPDGDYIKFLKENSNFEIKEGNIVTTKGKVLGKHKGLISYTIGQRKGLGIGGGDVYYVVKLDNEKNELVVGSEEDLYSTSCTAIKTNLILYDKIENEILVNAKIRYSSKPIKAKIKMNENNNDIDVAFIEKAKSVTSGQSIVFYTDDDVLIGGGIIK